MTRGIKDRDLNSKQQQLDGKDHPGDRCVEGGGHSGRCSAGEQHFPLRRRGMKDLADQRAYRAPGLDDRSFGAERPAGANGNRGRERFEDCDSRRNAAPVHQNRLHGLRNPVAFNLGGSILGHEADDETSNDRSDDRPQTKMVQPGTREVKPESVKEEEVRKERNQFVERVRNHAGHEADRASQRGHQCHPELGGRCHIECSGRRDGELAAVPELRLPIASSPGKGLVVVLV